MDYKDKINMKYKKVNIVVSLLAALAYASLLAALFLALTSCKNMGTRSFGGSSEIHLEKGQRLLEITWKNSDLWILTEPMDSAYIPNVKTFYEKSDLGVLEGTVTIYESK